MDFPVGWDISQLYCDMTLACVQCTLNYNKVPKLDTLLDIITSLLLILLSQME